MANRKEFPLAIILRTVDRATAGLRQIHAQVTRTLEPVARVGRGFASMGRWAGRGLPGIAKGFSGVGRALSGIAMKFAGLTAAAGLSIGALKQFVIEGDKLAKTADRLGISIDALAALRFAAQRAGASVEEFDGVMDIFSRRLGEARSGMGELAGSLKTISPTLLKQLKATKTTEEALLLMSDAMTKVKDPAKRALLANLAFGRSGKALINLLGGGSKAIKEMMERHRELAGSQERYARQSEIVEDALTDAKTAFGGVRAAIVSGLAPAFTELLEKVMAFFKEHRAEIAAWAKEFGEKLPGRVREFVASVKSALAAVKPFWDFIGGLKGAVIALAAVIGLKLVVAVYALGAALMANPIGAVIVLMGALAAAVALVVKHWEPISGFFEDIWWSIKEVFADAWKFIKGIVDKINGAVDKVVGAVRKVGNFAKGVGNFFTGDRPQITTGTTRSLATGGKSESHVVVELKNAPPGTRVAKDPRSTGDVDLNVGYAMGIP